MVSTSSNEYPADILPSTAGAGGQGVAGGHPHQEDVGRGGAGHVRQAQLGYHHRRPDAVAHIL